MQLVRLELGVVLQTLQLQVEAVVRCVLRLHTVAGTVFCPATCTEKTNNASQLPRHPNLYLNTK